MLGAPASTGHPDNHLDNPGASSWRTLGSQDRLVMLKKTKEGFSCSRRTTVCALPLDRTTASQGAAAVATSVQKENAVMELPLPLCSSAIVYAMKLVSGNLHVGYLPYHGDGEGTN